MSQPQPSWASDIYSGAADLGQISTTIGLVIGIILAIARYISQRTMMNIILYRLHPLVATGNVSLKYLIKIFLDALTSLSITRPQFLQL